MPKVTQRRPRDDDEAPAQAAAPRGPARPAPYSLPWLREKFAVYAFGTVVCGALMVAMAAWMGGSLGQFGKRMNDGFGVIMSSAGLSVKKVVVLGLDGAVKEKAEAAAAITIGDSMLNADPYAIKQRVEKLDAVGSVKVYRFWPDQVTIIAETRQPVALWEGDGDWRVIDQRGRTFASASPQDYLTLPHVMGDKGAEAAPSLIATMADYPDVAMRVATAYRIAGRRWDLKLKGGTEVSLPEDARLKEALAGLNLLHTRSRVLDLPLQKIDARHPERFALRPAPAARTPGGV